MPIYTFKCTSCFQTRDITQSMDASAPVCPRCEDSSCGIHLPIMERVFKPTGKPQFKGSGFYETDYKKGKPK